MQYAVIIDSQYYIALTLYIARIIHPYIYTSLQLRSLETICIYLYGHTSEQSLYKQLTR